ncbi:MAG: YbhB/YbcL family Raf kinase inhibitor-like protein [Candidatus Eisenbacteria bacterium]|nr:YbhB/YbcL family Raf kinase inhibitor-like protein [Candidatus Eisenbacteria bacterium]MCC7143437.1 YbhB/YbcL family Raf kinase inhibitor-like protein [Candidatus Eisenbacteria bacterium]
MGTIELRSESVSPGAPIPALHTCDGANRSPALRWTAGPEGTVSYAIVMDDLDAPLGVWVHWLVWNVSGNEIEPGLPLAAIPTAYESRSRTWVQGRNSWGRLGYSGPCPAMGEAHRYRIRVFALDRSLDLPPGSGLSELEAALGQAKRAEGELIATYLRSPGSAARDRTA